MKLTKKPEKSSTGMAVTGPTKVATWGAEAMGVTSLPTCGQHFTPNWGQRGGKAPSHLQGSGSSSDEKPKGLGHQGGGGGQGGEEQEARGLGGLARHPVHDAAVGDGADHLHGDRGATVTRGQRHRPAGPSPPTELPAGGRDPFHSQPGPLGGDWPCHMGIRVPAESSPGRAHLPWSWPGNRL